MAAQEIDNSTTWGKELWDQFDNIATHTQKGIDFIERFGGFIRDRSAIEVEYALKLRRLVKNYQPKKSKEDEENEFSSLIAFKNVLKEVADLAGQREVVAENLQNQVLQGILLLAKNLREERKKALNQGASLTQSLHTQIGTLDRAKRSYEKAFREAEKAIESYHKADADFHLSRADVEKQRVNMNIRNSQSEDAKSEYANQLQITNKQQQQHYQIALPEVFNRLQELDEKRTRGMKEFIKRSADVEYEVSPIIAHCLEGIVKAADSINEKDDSMIVIEKYQSGFQPPGDIPFEDLSKPDPDAANNSQTHNSSTGLNHMTGKGTTKDKLKKRVGIFGIFTGNKKILEACINVKNNLSTDGLKEDFSDLPPTQRRKKLTAKVQELQQKVAQEQAASDGLMKMKGVYEANSMLGDPRTVEEQLNESVNRLDRLRHELLRYQKLLEQANNQSFIQHSPQSNRVIQNGQRSSRHSNGSSNHENSHEDNGEDHPDDAGSLSRSASESSVQQAQNGLNINNNGSSASPESGLGTSHTSLPGSGQGSTNEQPMNEEFYEADTPLGTCRALYPFDATSEGSIPMSEGEELQVIEVDQGDGWTRVRRFSSKGWEEGFVPTSYIECTLYA
ncbi:formin-binding protein 1-like isoform X1 [Anopheles gambiae]|uniref:formin-binding protein 1-like isoform X1 n=1 Tax=Anopheles gambiae TaxID=7165 RepID=UPI002AC8E769|nr:formin-binding protein 1-like isoform X1 [Anopheles gambiae]XP_061501429.1 formin-binding protein 1-like isoform X1 [Anopheles gambiae]XP_061501430.1 formin-binding protein 1-like isoform X1 [Anopheles gambiae]XP_061501431.1 formin-binding protein 1-like isoform X1 [Anopheles gambiae]XP_061501432.1 formin-binding protein 1-like isoform X1 [Anopheles gambiae]